MEKQTIFLTLLFLNGVVIGYLLLVFVKVCQWPEYYNTKILRKYINKSSTVNSFYTLVFISIFLIVLIFPLIYIGIFYSGGKLGPEFRERLPQVYIVGFFLGVTAYVLRENRLLKKGDPLKTILEKDKSELPILLEATKNHSSKSWFDEAKKNPRVRNSRYQFERVAFVYEGQKHLFEKYDLDPERCPQVLFVRKDGSRLIIDNQDSFDLSYLRPPERYANLLESVIKMRIEE